MSTPLRDLLNDLLLDAPTRAAFDADPGRFLTEHGWDALDGADVHAALGALVQEIPLGQAALIAPLVMDDPEVDAPAGLAGAIAGLAAATAAVDDDPFDRSLIERDSPVAAQVTAEAHEPSGLDLTHEDPAGGIDAGLTDRAAGADDPTSDDPANGGPATHGRDTGVRQDDADDDADDDGLRFGEPSTDPSSGIQDDPSSSGDRPGEDDVWDVEPVDAVQLDGLGGDPAALLDDDQGLPPYDPAEDASTVAEPDEPDDGFPY